MDQPRRTALQQAKIFQALAQNQQQTMLNDLIYNASATYLVWQQYAYFKTILLENIAIGKTYFENTKQSFFNGERKLGWILWRRLFCIKML